MREVPFNPVHVKIKLRQQSYKITLRCLKYVVVI